jgi:DNA helicase II / ATP-dependent DNA helicase PcrA
VPPESILLLTFTRRAAREMLSRASSLLDGRAERVRGGTFHAVCLQILRRFAERIHFPRNFTILDSADSTDVLDLIRTDLGLHRSERRFPKKATLQTVISAAASRDAPLAHVVAADYPQFVEHVEGVERVAATYATYKQRHGMMDYDDLLTRTIELCLADTEARRQIATSNYHVLVDEYQDTNRQQARLVELFSHVHTNVTAVGDDAQSIYGFRGADLRNILSFPETFPGTALHKLERNYRSTQPILDLSNMVLAKASAGYRKHLFSERQQGEKPALVHAPDSRWQSRFVSQMVLQLREEGVELNRMAVLFRGAHNAFDLETELGRHRIPYVKYGGLKLSEAAHVRDVLAHLRVAENPGDVVAWMRILKLVEGVGPRTAQQIISRLAGVAEPYGIDLSASPRNASELALLANLLKGLRHDAAPAGAQVDRVL